MNNQQWQKLIGILNVTQQYITFITPQPQFTNSADISISRVVAVLSKQQTTSNQPKYRREADCYRSLVYVYSPPGKSQRPFCGVTYCYIQQFSTCGYVRGYVRDCHYDVTVAVLENANMMSQRFKRTLLWCHCRFS